MAWDQRLPPSSKPGTRSNLAPRGLSRYRTPGANPSVSEPRSDPAPGSFNWSFGAASRTSSLQDDGSRAQAQQMNRHLNKDAGGESRKFRKLRVRGINKRLREGEAGPDPLPEDSLAVVVQSLAGFRVQIDLLDETSVTGTVDEADESMNVSLTNAEVRAIGKAPVKQPSFECSARKIRFIHFPEDLSEPQALSQNFDNFINQRQEARTKFLRRKKRAPPSQTYGRPP